MNLFNTYAEFDAAYKFSERAGFQLTKLQIQDVERFLTWDSSLNLYEVGGGKTVVSTVVALMRGNTHKLVTVPPVLITPWVNWLTKVSDNILKYKGDPRERKAMDLKAAQWLVMSHAIFRSDFKRIDAELHGDLEVIVDEAHFLKNSESVLYRDVKRLML